MSITEILEELPKLNTEDLCLLRKRLSKLENQEEFIPTPEMLAAIDEGIRSAETEPHYTIEEVRKMIDQKLKRCVQRSK